MVLTHSLKKHLCPPVAVALVTGTLLSVSAAVSRADVAITAQQTTSTGQTPPATRAIKLFFKGADARLEVAGKPILLYDGKGNILYGLDPARKTYYMTVPTEREPTDLTAGLGGQAQENIKLDLRQTDQTLTLAGMAAHQYLVTGTVTFSRNRPQGSRRSGGHRRGGGGFPLFSPATVDQNSGGYGEGRAGGGESGQSRALTLPQWSISGEIWLSDTLKFPAKENTLLTAQVAAASAGPFQQPLADALDKHKGVPLLARITVTHIPASAGGRAVDQYGGVPEGQRAAPSPTSTATTLTIQSISTNPLADTFFRASLDDALVAAPLDAYDPNTPG